MPLYVNDGDDRMSFWQPYLLPEAHTGRKYPCFVFAPSASWSSGSHRWWQWRRPSGLPCYTQTGVGPWRSWKTLTGDKWTTNRLGEGKENVMAREWKKIQVKETRSSPRRSLPWIETCLRSVRSSNPAVGRAPISKPDNFKISNWLEIRLFSHLWISAIIGKSRFESGQTCSRSPRLAWTPT